MDRKGKKVLWIVVLGLIYGLMLATLLLPKKEYSEQENRYLEEFPKLSIHSLMDTSFMQDLENYLSDHFALRDPFMTVRTWYERLLGKNQINGIYLCRDGFYIEEYKTPEQTERIVAAIGRLEERLETADLTVLFVPTAVTVYAEKLPAAAKNASQTEELARIYAGAARKAEALGALPVQASQNSRWFALDGREILLLDITDALLEGGRREQLYYRLDHHWTTAGAYLAYTEYCAAKGLVPLGRDAFSEQVVTEEFQGTVYSKLNDATAGADRITVFARDGLSLTVRYEDSGEVTDTLYAPEYLEKKDKYSYFLNNIHSFLTITNEEAQTDDALVLVKDSYANCLVPFLVSHYRTVYVFDTRYYKESVTAFVNGHAEVTDVLMLYNLGTVDADLGIGGIY